MTDPANTHAPFSAPDGPPTVFSGAMIYAAAEPAAMVEALRRAFLDDARVPDRLHYPLGSDGDALLIMPAWRTGGAIGVKVVSVIPGNAALGRPTVDGAYLLLDGRTGASRALFDAAALTQVRTAAVSALACSLMARPDARHLLMVGTGALAPHLIRAHLAVRPIEKVTIWGRSQAKMMALADRLGELPHPVEGSDDLAASISQADIVSCATLSETPLVLGRDVRPGTHIDLVGSFKPTMREADAALVGRARVVVDSWTALVESGDLMDVSAGGLAGGGPIRSLQDIVNAPTDARQSRDEITLFKSVGSALSDLAVAQLLYSLGASKALASTGIRS